MEHRKTRPLMGVVRISQAVWCIVWLSLGGAILFRSSPASAQECPLLFSPTDVTPSLTYDYSSPDFASLFSSLNSSISSYVTQHAINSYAVAVVHRNQTIYTSGLTSTKFRIASITKTFTALGAFMLRGQGLVNLDDKVNKHLPGFSIINPFGNQHDTSLRELMGHAAGFPQQLCPFLMTCTDNETEILQQIAGMELISPPWSEYPAYSNLGVSLLGRAWEKATVPSMSWEDFVSENILKPLGMTDSGVNVSGVDLAPNSDAWALQDLGWSAPAAQMYSTADDLSKYLVFLLNAEPPLVSQTVIREWTSPATIFPDGLGGYSFPWELYKLYANSTDFVISKAGNINGYVSHLVFDPPTELGLVVLTVIEPGVSSGSADELAGNIMRALVPTVQSINQQMIVDLYAGFYVCRGSEVFFGPTLNSTVQVREGYIDVYVSPTVGLLANVSIDMLSAGEPAITAGTFGLALKNASENSFWFGSSDSCSDFLGSISASPDLLEPNTPGSLYTDVVTFDPVKGSVQWPAVGTACYKSGYEPKKRGPHLPFYVSAIFSLFMFYFVY